MNNLYENARAMLRQANLELGGVYNVDPFGHDFCDLGCHDGERKLAMGVEDDADASGVLVLYWIIGDIEDGQMRDAGSFPTVKAAVEAANRLMEVN